MTVPGLLFAIGGLCFGLLVYPYLIYPLVLKRLPRRPIRKDAGVRSMSLLFCAYNESASIEAKIDNLAMLKKRHPDLEILAYDDGSSDQTASALAAHPDLITVVRGSGRLGKAAGMKQLAARASGEILVFTDANVLLVPDALANLLPYYGDPKVGGVCGTLVYDADIASATAQVGAFYWSIDERLRTLESATGNVAGADGSIFSVRRALYPVFPDTLLDDFTVSMNIVFGGHRLVKASDVLASEKSVANRGEEFRRKMRIGARAWHTHTWLRPQLRKMAALDRFKYFSRKVLRWYGGAFLLAGGLFSATAVALISPGVLLGMIVWSCMVVYAAPRLHVGPIAKGIDVVLALLGTLAGILSAMRGKQVVTWVPAQTR